jgi:lauroyl/myristoyl acyltransferase
MSRDVLGTHPRLRVLVFRAKFTIASACPMWLGRLLAYTVGTLLWAGDAGGRKVVRRNLAHFIPPRCSEALSRAVRRNYISFCWYIYESFRVHRLPPQFFQPPHLIMVDPWGVFAQRPLRTPAILVTVHINWELTAAAVHHLGLAEAVDIISLSSGDSTIDALFERKRNAVGMRSLSLEQAPLSALRALRAGKILGLVGDRDYSGTGLLVRFAGDLLRLPLGPAALAVQTHAPIIPMILVRQGHTRFKLVIGRPIHGKPGVAKNAQVTVLTEQLAATMTRFIATAPAQWVSFHDAWATRHPPARPQHRSA